MCISYLLLLPLVRDDGAAVDDEPVARHPLVQLEPVLHRRDGAQHGQAVHPGLDVGRGAVLVGQHLGHAADLQKKYMKRSMRVFCRAMQFLKSLCMP